MDPNSFDARPISNSHAELALARLARIALPRRASRRPESGRCRQVKLAWPVKNRLTATGAPTL